MALNESRTRNVELAAKVETTYGTNPTIAGATDGMNCIDSNVPWNADIPMQEFRNHGPSLSRMSKDVPGIRMGRLTVTIKFQGSGTAGTAVQGEKAMLQACGLTETIVASTSVTYAPSTIANLKSSAVQVTQGLNALMLGVYGNAVFSARSGEPNKVAFAMQGLYAAPTIGSIASWSAGATGADRSASFLGVNLSINNGTDNWTGATMLGYSLDLGNDIKQIPDANSATGLKKLLFADRNPSLTLDLCLDLDTTGTIIQADEFYANVLATVTHDIQFSTNGGAGNILTFNMDTAQPRTPIVQDGDGYRTMQIPYKGYTATAEGELSAVKT